MKLLAPDGYLDSRIQVLVCPFLGLFFFVCGLWWTFVPSSPFDRPAGLAALFGAVPLMIYGWWYGWRKRKNQIEPPKEPRR